jgi:hypothetical protein
MFWDWVDNRQIVRRLVLFFTLVMTYLAFSRGYDFAVLIPPRFDGVGTAAVIAAFTAPIAYLQKAAFDSYLVSKGNKND